ncbi:MAG TPA: signal peptidase I [Terriglobia bacterium]
MNPETQKTVDPAAGAETPASRSTAREYLESLVVTVILALFGTTFLVQAFKIPSSSMEETLLIGDHLMVDKVSYGPASFGKWLLPYDSIERDQIIVFRYPLDPATYFVKRIIGIPGDRIRLQEKSVIRNGVPLEEPHAVHKDDGFSDFRDNFPDFVSGSGFSDWMMELPEYVQAGELVVPEGRYFVMGDNRDFSSDSRYWGFVPRENIVGKPLALYWSFESSSEEYRRTGVGDYAVRFFDIIVHFPQKTRWNRMFRPVH